MPPEVTPTTTPEENKADPLDMLFGTVEAELASEKKEAPGASLYDITQEVKGEERMAAAGKPDDSKKDEPKPDAAAPKADAPKDGAAAAPAAEPKAEKPLKARKARDLVPPAPVPEPAKQPDATPATPPAQPAAKDDDFLPEEKQQLKLARDAERLMPDRYAGYGAKMEKYLRDHAKFLAEQTKKDPTAVFDDENPEYQAWLKANAVRFTPAEREALTEARIREDVRAEVQKEQGAKINEVHDELFRRDEEPKVAKRANDFFNALCQSQFPDALKAVMSTKGRDAAKAELGLEYQITERIFSTAASDIEELYRISTVNPRTGSPLKPVDANNPQHQRLDSLVKTICEDFEREGGAERMKDGKRFVTRATFFQLSPAQQAQVWTFGVDDIAERAKTYAGRACKQAIKVRHDELAAMGFRRQAAAAPAAAPAVEHQSAPAMPRPSAVPPAAKVTPPLDEERLGAALFGS